MDNKRKKWIRIGIIGAAAVLTIVCYLSGRTGSDLFQTESSNSDIRCRAVHLHQLVGWLYPLYFLFIWMCFGDFHLCMVV